ncbi:GntR family transcriptional regulator [Runella slithyformis]|uniref:Transcriptional regulator, GntR family with UTRA sensor domain n=1 Tax=Runella slithyformis (strain ATCC 29530 / DSM 19594 / LMG 11500 / NCIMB 11436 / LSU 4) TaxID=761193 RepID=A0A7U3ZNK0_RUNSL|nr:GntR family transcriptional regulator [Runella slithyformis]AEI50494.1 transcriptional regulator, GntR family with UTRA sensor domain [Runella slithyformis DSM 19594]
MSEVSPRLPHYQHLYETLRRQLVKGIYETGSLLPSEKELQQTYKLTQPTVRQALSMLAEEGFIKKYQGKGSVVQPLPIGLGMLSIQPHHPNQMINEEDIRTEIIKKPQLMPFPEHFFFTPLNSSDLFYYLERLRRVNEEVIFYERLAFPAAEVSDFHKQKLENRSLFNVFRNRYNIIVKGGEEKVWATAAQAPLTKIMHIAENTPVLRLEKCIETNRPHFTIYSSLYACTDTYLLKGRF